MSVMPFCMLMSANDFLPLYWAAHPSVHSCISSTCTPCFFSMSVALFSNILTASESCLVSLLIPMIACLTNDSRVSLSFLSTEICGPP